MIGYFHVWFGVKNRRAALGDEVRDFAKRAITDIAGRGDIRLLAIETALDHTHLLLGPVDGERLPVVMHQLKGASARLVLDAYPELRLDIGANAFWQKGYGYRLIPRDQLPAVTNYIRTQGTRPLRHNS